MRPWRTLARRTLLSRPPWMEVGEERVALPDGREVDGFLWVRTRDFAAMVAITDRDEVILVRSYKHGTRTVSLAVPAGYIEDGEEPLAAATRELRKLPEQDRAEPLRDPHCERQRPRRGGQLLCRSSAGGWCERRRSTRSTRANHQGAASRGEHLAVAPVRGDGLSLSARRAVRADRSVRRPSSPRSAGGHRS